MYRRKFIHYSFVLVRSPATVLSDLTIFVAHFHNHTFNDAIVKSLTAFLLISNRKPNTVESNGAFRELEVSKSKSLSVTATGATES